MTKTNAKVVQALQAAFNGPHDYSCDWVSHMRERMQGIPMRHIHRWKTARREALQTAPACSCHVALAEEALRSIGVEPKKEE